MLTPLSADMLDHGLAALRASQLLGDLGEADDGEFVPEPGNVSHRDLAAFTGLSVATIHGVERLALAKLARGLREQGLPPHLADRFCALIDDIDQPELF